MPTAARIVDDLLLRLYADAHHLVRDEIDISDPVLRDRIRRYYESANGMPALGDPRDYSRAFELALPDQQPRRRYFRAILDGRGPNYGHRVLGAFLAHALTDLVPTTNFDDLVEWGSGNILITHALADLQSRTDDGTAHAKIAEGLLNTTSIRVFLHQNPGQVSRLLADLGLTTTETDLLAAMSPLQALWKIGSHTALVDHHVIDTGWALCDTDAAMAGRPAHGHD